MQRHIRTYTHIQTHTNVYNVYTSKKVGLCFKLCVSFRIYRPFKRASLDLCIVLKVSLSLLSVYPFFYFLSLSRSNLHHLFFMFLYLSPFPHLSLSFSLRSNGSLNPNRSSSHSAHHSFMVLLSRSLSLVSLFSISNYSIYFLSLSHSLSLAHSLDLTRINEHIRVYI